MTAAARFSSLAPGTPRNTIDTSARETPAAGGDILHGDDPLVLTGMHAHLLRRC